MTESLRILFVNVRQYEGKNAIVNIREKYSLVLKYRTTLYLVRKNAYSTETASLIASSSYEWILRQK